VPFSKLAESILGKSYTLSIVFVTPAKIKTLNRTYRNKNVSTDILSFDMSKTEGELYISMPDVKKKAPSFGMSPVEYFKYLVIHGMVHLKGLDHGKKMDMLERKFCKKFKFSYPA
jgi:probable rRNA maturation factor